MCSAARSATCPAITPLAPAAWASSRASSERFCWAMSLKASMMSASPANTALASPNWMWQVGLPRRRSSSSMQGRSSWMRVEQWKSSMARADGKACSSSAPQHSVAAMQRMGRIRLPPLKMEYLMARFKTLFSV